MEIFKTHDMRVPVYNWATSLDNLARDQVVTLAKHPLVYHHIALMPDAHGGSGSTIGTVFGTQNAIFPCAASVDIGCGMCAIPTGVNAIKEITDKCGNSVLRNVPVGHNGHKEPQSWNGFNYKSSDSELTRMIQEEAPFKLGSLGGNNHFIEWQTDEKGKLWIMIHSGSRNIGFKIAVHHIRKSKKVNPCKLDVNLAHFYSDSAVGQDYLRDMNWAVDYAFENRMHMMLSVLEITKETYERNGIPFTFDIDQLINISHNYVSKELHYGEDLWVHRKGATLADRGTIGIIPGSMGTRSYIVKGLGNEKSFCSCSHGAGRKMSRRDAKDLFTKKGIKDELNKAGVTCFSPSGDIRDESPGAYKDINEVMNDQKDLVKILECLRSITVVKG